MQFLRVLPNPWAAIDKDGHPCGVCPRDPGADGGGPGQFVGARLCDKHTKVLQDFGKSAKFGDHAKHELRSPLQSTKYSYMGTSSTEEGLASQLAGKDPVDLPVTSYYKERIREGSLIPADGATAKAAGVAFVSPAQFFAFRALKTAQDSETTATDDASAVATDNGSSASLDMPATESPALATRKRSSTTSEA